jgi:hypothetical protein
MMKFLAIVLAGVISNVGLAVAPFSLKQMNGDNVGQMYNSSSHPNGVFLLEGFFNGCPYCHDNAPLIDEIAEAFKDEPRVQVLDIGRDCRESDYRSWIARHNPNHPVLRDCDQLLLSQLGISGYPTSVIADCSGKEVYRKVGSMQARDVAAAKAAITKALETQCIAP